MGLRILELNVEFFLRKYAASPPGPSIESSPSNGKKLGINTSKHQGKKTPI
jgi:hypothetical protein